MTNNLDLRMKGISEAWADDIAAGQSAMSDEVRAVVDGLKVGERMSVHLGHIEQANTLESLNMARGKADAILSCALAYDDLRKTEDWKLLALHIDTRADERRSKINAMD